MVHCPFDSFGNKKAFLFPIKITSENLHAYSASGWLLATDETKDPPINKYCEIDPSVEKIVRSDIRPIVESVIDPIVEIIIEEKRIKEKYQNDYSFEANEIRRNLRIKKESIQKNFKNLKK